MPDVCGLAPEFPFRMSRAVRDGLPRLVGLVGGQSIVEAGIAEVSLLEPVRQGSGCGFTFEFVPASHRHRGLGFRLRQIQSTPAGTRSLPFVSITVRNRDSQALARDGRRPTTVVLLPSGRKDDGLCRASIRMRSRRRGSLVPASFVPSAPMTSDADPAGVRTRDRSRSACKPEKLRARTSLRCSFMTCVMQTMERPLQDPVDAKSNLRPWGPALLPRRSSPRKQM
ncbi:hypothetical protein ABIB94_007867 [Bradyrhizobium sp. JR7.2]